MTARLMFRILIVALAWITLATSSLTAQREPADPLTFATTAFRARQPVSKVAPELRSKYRQDGEAMTRTLLSAGYAAPDVAAHLVSTDREPAGATVAWLTKAGTDARRAWDAVSRVTREPAEKVAAEAMQQIGRTTTPIMATWGSTFRTAGLSALQIAGIYRQVGSDPEETARALKESGHNATEVADALAESSTNESIIEILYEIGFSAAEVAQAALESLQMQFRQLLEVILSISDEQARALRVAAAAGSYGVSAGDVAAELNAMGVVITIIMTIVAVIVTIAALTVGLAGLAIPQLITVLAVVLGLGTLPDRIAEVLHEMQVPVDRAVAALLAHLPIDEATNAIREGYDASAETTATALAAAGEAWPDIIDAVFDTWDSFETTVDIVPADRVNAPDVMAVLFDVFAASIDETNRDKVFWLMKAGMTADNIAKGLRDSLGLDAGEIAELLVDAGMTSATAIANALLGGGFTQPLAVAQALADAGFTYDQVQAALMAAFTLTMQQIAQILGTVFGG